MFRDVECLLRPKVIAIVGASDSSRGGWAQEIYDNLEHCGFPAKLYLVNPKRKELWGRPVYPDFAVDPGARRSRADDRPLAVDSRHAHRGRRQRLEMRADLCRAIRRRRRRPRPGPRAGAEEALRQQDFASPARIAWARWRFARSSCSIRPSACGRCGPARSAWCSSPAARSSSGCSRLRCAASIFPTRCRAATSSISISPTTSASWSTTSTPRSSPAWWKASAGRRRSWPRPRRRSRRASRSCWSSSAAASAARRRRRATPARSPATMRCSTRSAASTASCAAPRSTT